MNKQQLAAAKQALEALEKSLPRLAPYGEQDWLDSCKAITALQSIISQHALDKKAENARELGLSYDDEPKIGCVNHDCDKCKATQPSCPECVFGMCHCGAAGGQKQPAPVQPVAEPTAEMLATFKEAWKGGSIWRDRVTFALSEVFRTSKLYTTPPAAQKPWVGLDEDEVEDCARGCANHAELARAIESKLKEKNT